VFAHRTAITKSCIARLIFHSPMSFEEEETALPEEEQDEPTPEMYCDPDVLKGNCHFLILGDPPSEHSPFATPSKKPK
jgi:hypothetical protein